MSNVGWRFILSCEHVTQVASAIDTLNFSSHSVGVRQVLHGAWYFLIERWPATMGVELVLGAVQRRVASSAGINSRFKKAIVFPRKSRLRSLAFDYVSFLC